MWTIQNTTTRTFPCISRRMVRVTLSPPSDWTLMGSMLGLDVKEGAWSRERGVPRANEKRRG